MSRGQERIIYIALKFHIICNMQIYSSNGWWKRIKAGIIFLRFSIANQGLGLLKNLAIKIVRLQGNNYKSDNERFT